jgi:hypothetical protein
MSNEIITGIGPKKTTEKLWEATSIGGWEGDHNLTIDISKRYIIFAWVKKDPLIDTDPCTLNFGIDGSLINNETGATVFDPNFFVSASWMTGGDLNSYIDEWLLCVGNIFPSTTANTITTYSGIYDLTGERIVNGIDYRWNADPTPWNGERIIQDNSSSEILYIARPSIYQYDTIKGPFIEQILGV